MYLKLITIIFLINVSPLAAAPISKANPIVLIHGMGGFEKIGPVTYWGKIAENLSAQGYKVYTVRTSPFSSVTNRVTQNFGYNGGKSLVDSIDTIVKSNGGRKAVIVGHSMGGLDARMIASPNGLNRTDLVDSVLTIGTPHRGTSIADLGLNLVDNGSNNQPSRIKRITHKVMSIFGLSSAQDNPLETFEDLTTARANAFNQKYINNPNVQYYSIAGVGKDKIPAELVPTHDILQAVEGPNDGLVSRQSASWGNYLGEWTATHQEQTDLRHLDSLIENSSETIHQRNAARLKDAIDDVFEHRNNGTYVDSASGGQMNVGNVREALSQADNTETDKATKSLARRAATRCVSRIMAAMIKE